MKAKKRRLRKWVKVTITLIILGVFIALIEKGIANYVEYLEECDAQKGYTCNIFGK